MKNTNGGVLLLVKLLTTGFQPATLLKLTLLQGCFSRFFFKLYKWYQIAQKHHILVVRKMCLVNLLSNMEMIKTSISRD